MDTAPDRLADRHASPLPATSPPTCIPSPTLAHPEVGPLVITRGDGIFVEDDHGAGATWRACPGCGAARSVSATRA